MVGVCHNSGTAGLRTATVGRAGDTGESAPVKVAREDVKPPSPATRRPPRSRATAAERSCLHSRTYESAVISPMSDLRSDINTDSPHIAPIRYLSQTVLLIANILTTDILGYWQYVSIYPKSVFSGPTKPSGADFCSFQEGSQGSRTEYSRHFDILPFITHFSRKMSHFHSRCF